MWGFREYEGLTRQALVSHDLGRSDDFYTRGRRNSADRPRPSLPFLSDDLADADDGTPMPIVKGSIEFRPFPIEPADFRPACLIAPPDSFLPLHHP